MSFIKVDVLVKYSSQKKNSERFVWFLMPKNDSEKMLIFNICRRGLMPHLIKKSWTVSIQGGRRLVMVVLDVPAVRDFIRSNQILKRYLQSFKYLDYDNGSLNFYKQLIKCFPRFAKKSEHSAVWIQIFYVHCVSYVYNTPNVWLKIIVVIKMATS